MTVRIQACALRAVTPQIMRVGTQILVDLDMTTEQRFAAVAELLGVGIPEQVAYDGLCKLFPEWFDEALLNARAEPEVRDSTWGEFNAAKEAA